MLPSLPQCGNRDDNGAQIVGGKEAEVACCIIIIRYGNIFQFIFGESATTHLSMITWSGCPTHTLLGNPTNDYCTGRRIPVGSSSRSNAQEEEKTEREVEHVSE